MGSLRRICERLANEQLKFDYVYCISGKRRGNNAAIIKVNDLTKAQKYSTHRPPMVASGKNLSVGGRRGYGNPPPCFTTTLSANRLTPRRDVTDSAVLRGWQPAVVAVVVVVVDPMYQAIG
ncbi:MAG: hypothetical protein VB853_16040 [Pirellulales bacterium]